GDGPQRRRELLALVGPADLQVLGALRQVGQVLLPPLDGGLDEWVARQRELRVLRETLTRLDLRGELRSRILQRCGELLARGRETLVGAAHGQPDRLRAARGKRERVGQLAARAAPE